MVSCLNPSRASHSPPPKILASVPLPWRPHLDHHYLPPYIFLLSLSPCSLTAPCWLLPLAFLKIFSLSLIFYHAGGFQVLQTFQLFPPQDLSTCYLLGSHSFGQCTHLLGLSLIAISSEKSSLILQYLKTSSPTLFFLFIELTIVCKLSIYMLFMSSTTLRVPRRQRVYLTHPLYYL